jgi:hypothetical protein
VPRFLVHLAALVVLVLPSGASAATLGEQRVLMMLTTWGPEPYTPAELRASLDEAAAYMRSVSYGKTTIVGEVTPWLHALNGQPGCSTEAIAAATTAAAQAAGFNPAQYTTLGIAMPHNPACFWSGAYFAPGIWLNGRNDRQVIVHELGHTYGVTEEGSAWICNPGCHAQPYMNPFSVMGHGFSDFGAWEKHAFGWLDRVAEPARRVTIGAIDRTGPNPHALRVLAAGDEYWLEYRPPAPLWAYGTHDAAHGVAIHAGSNGLGEPSRFSGRNFLLYDPVGRGRPAIQAGETFSVRGVFAVRVAAAGADSAELEFRWTDRTRPARPRILAARARRGRLALRWRRGLERGSGLVAHEVFVGGRRAARLPTVRTVANLLIATEDRLTVRVPRGRQVVSIVAVDRAGNRSRPAVRRLRAP